MAGVEGGGHAVPVQAPGQGLPHRRVPAGARIAVEAHIQHGGGGIVPGLVIAAEAQGVGAGKVGGHQGDVPGIEGVDQIVRLGHRVQRDGLDGQGLVLPPVRPGGQPGVLPPALHHIGPGAQRLLALPLDDGDVQQGGQGPVGPVEGDHHRAVLAGHAPDAPHPAGEPGALPHGQPQGGRRLVSREGATVGKGDAGAEGKGPGEAVLTDGVALAQHRLGLEAAVQGKQPLPHQASQGHVGGVLAEDGVEGPLRTGQSKGPRRLRPGRLGWGGGGLRRKDLPRRGAGA